MRIIHCALTGQQLKPSIQLDESKTTFIEYEIGPIGIIKLDVEAYKEILNFNKTIKAKLTSVCRDINEDGSQIPYVTKEFIVRQLEDTIHPSSFQEKLLHFIKYLYKNGGKEFKDLNIMLSKDYSICFCEDGNEFKRIIEKCIDRNLVECKHPTFLAGGNIFYQGVKLTDFGIEEVEKTLPQMPMIDIANMQVATGDKLIDDKINHAKKLFFNKPQTMDNMRSACEAMSYILEPLRQDLKNYFASKDVESFFQIVNSFDIRHNKEFTNKIEHKEQLEWIFYTLLNTISTYIKLKQKN